MTRTGTAARMKALKREGDMTGTGVAHQLYKVACLGVGENIAVIKNCVAAEKSADCTDGMVKLDLSFYYCHTLNFP